MKHKGEVKEQCLIKALRGMGFKIADVGDGPFYVKEDGSKWLARFGYTIEHVSSVESIGLGRWIVCKGKHCFSLRRKGGDNLLMVDGTSRKRIAAGQLNALTEGTTIFQVPNQCS